MSVATTRETMNRYLDALVARAPYGQYFRGDVVCTLMGEDVMVTGRDAVEQFIIGYLIWWKRPFLERPEHVEADMTEPVHADLARVGSSSQPRG